MLARTQYPGQGAGEWQPRVATACALAGAAARRKRALARPHERNCA